MGDERDPVESVEPTRRHFIKKMAAAAFAVPVITSFGMESLASASSGSSTPKQSFPNQTRPPRDDDHGHDDRGHDDRGHDDDGKGRKPHH